MPFVLCYKFCKKIKNEGLPVESKRSGQWCRSLKALIIIMSRRPRAKLLAKKPGARQNNNISSKLGRSCSAESETQSVQKLLLASTLATCHSASLRPNIAPPRKALSAPNIASWSRSAAPHSHRRPGVPTLIAPSDHSDAKRSSKGYPVAEFLCAFADCADTFQNDGISASPFLDPSFAAATCYSVGCITALR